MKPFTKGFMIGIVAGIPLGIVAAFSGLVLLGFLASFLIGSGGLPQLPLPSASFPPPGQVTVYGATDYDWPLQTLDGEEISLSEFQGKPVFLNIWATWCPPCVQEMPSIQRLLESVEGEEVAVVLVSSESAETVQRFMEKRELDMPVYVTAADPPDTFRTAGVPATFIIDPEGTIVYRQVGAADWSSEQCVSFLRGLIR